MKGPYFRLTNLVTVFLIFSGLIDAQDKLSLSINEAINIGLKSSKTLHSSLMKYKSSEAKAKEVSTARLPSIKFNASYTRLSPVDPFSITTPFGNFEVSPSILNNYNFRFSLYQPLFTGFRLQSNSEIALYSANASQEEYNKDKSELAYNIKNAYWTLFKSGQFKKVMDENVDQIKAHLKDAQNLLAVGMLTNNDVLKIQVQLSDAMFRQIDAKNNYNLSMIGLNNVIGIPLSTQIILETEAELTQNDLGELDGLVNKAYENRSELKSADYRIKLSQSAVTMAKSGWYPQIGLTSNYYYNRPNQRIVPGKDRFDGTWDAGISLSMDIWNWLATSHQTEQAETQLSQSVDALGSIKDDVTLEVTQNYLNFQQAKEKITISKLAVQQAEENERIIGDKFKNGLALSSDLIDSEVALVQAKTNYTNSIVDFEMATARLSKSIGE